MVFCGHLLVIDVCERNVPGEFQSQRRHFLVDLTTKASKQIDADTRWRSTGASGMCSQWILSAPKHHLSAASGLVELSSGGTSSNRGSDRDRNVSGLQSPLFVTALVFVVPPHVWSVFRPPVVEYVAPALTMVFAAQGTTMSAAPTVILKPVVPISSSLSIDRISTHLPSKRFITTRSGWLAVVLGCHSSATKDVDHDSL